jgi:hypothetical protein
MKLVIELEVGPTAVKTYGDAIKIIRTQVGRVGSASHLQIAKPEYGDSGPLCDAKSDQSDIGRWTSVVISVCRLEGEAGSRLQTPFNSC